MLGEIRIYVEGGGDDRNTKADFRRAFGKFLISLRDVARSRTMRWSIIACGPRNAAFDNFKTALKVHPLAFNILVVDAEGPVATHPWAHLRQRDGWAVPDAPDEHCHLMVQVMEAWLIADMDALKLFYGRDFRGNRLPADPDVEAVDKTILEDSLKAATRDTTKGKYHKTRHAPKILEMLNVQTVRRKARHCGRLFDTLLNKMQGNR